MKDIDHEYTDNAVCPNCGGEDNNSWELDEDFESECPHGCGAVYCGTRIITAVYTTKLITTP